MATVLPDVPSQHLLKDVWDHQLSFSPRVTSMLDSASPIAASGPNLFGTNFEFGIRTEKTNIKLKEKISLSQDQRHIR
jgi:hypothetical protein